MKWKEVFKPSFLKILITILLLGVSVFVRIFPILQPYSPKLGAEYLGPLHEFSSIYYVLFDPHMGPSLYWLTYVFIVLYAGIFYSLSCLIVSCIQKPRNK